MFVYVVTVIVTRWFFDETFDDYFSTTDTTLLGVYESHESAKTAMMDDLNDMMRDTDQEVTGSDVHTQNDYHNDYYAVYRYSHTETKSHKCADEDWQREYRIYPASVNT